MAALASALVSVRAVGVTVGNGLGSTVGKGSGDGVPIPGKLQLIAANARLAIRNPSDRRMKHLLT